MGVERSITDHRIIPAYAGNAIHEQPAFVSLPDHPRVCGERLARITGTVSGFGSSPRMRGTRLIRSPLCTGLRIIPAYAGNAPSIRASRS